MKRILKYSFSILLLLIFFNTSAQQQADTVKARKSVSLGFDVTGPVLYSIDNSRSDFEGYLSYRLNYKYFIVLEPGYGSFNTDNYNYEYSCKGYFMRFGTDISMLQPVATKINHFAGIGLRYGLAVFQQETPFISMDSYWGEVVTSVESNRATAHFLELQGSIKAEIFDNLLIGWAVKLRTLIYCSGKNGEGAVYIPGMGGTDAFLSPAVSYYIIYRIPFRHSSGE